jgi:4-amino-4-deoxy-L-arabinose transferase-like glycosyltransferase
MVFDKISRSARQLAAHPWLAAALVFAFALVPRIIVALRLPAAVLWPDGERYMWVAENLLNGYGFGSLVRNQLSVPTQPLLIAAVGLLFGHSYVALRCFFAVLGAATCVLGFALAKRLFGPVAAAIAGVTLAIYPQYVYLSALFEYPQTFFIFSMGVTFVLFYEFLESKRMWALATSGLFLGLSILSVPTAILFAPLLLACLWFRRPSGVLRYAAILVAAISIPVGAWTARNYALSGELILVNQAGGINFWIANNETYYKFGKEGVIPACAPGHEESRFCVEFTAFTALGRRLGSQGLSEDQVIALADKAAWRNGIAFLRESPGRFALLTFRKFLQFWGPRPDAVTRGDAYPGRASTWIAVASYLPVLVLGLIAIYVSARRWRELLPIYAYFAVWSVAYSVFLPTTRYRLPLDFFLIIFSAYTLSSLVSARVKVP